MNLYYSTLLSTNLSSVFIVAGFWFSWETLQEAESSSAFRNLGATTLLFGTTNIFRRDFEGLFQY